MSSTTDLAYTMKNAGIDLNSGSKLTVKDGATVDYESGSALKLAGTTITSNAGELNSLDGVATTWPTKIPGTHTFTIGAEAANVINVGVQLKDIAGTAIASSKLVSCYLSDSSTGDGLTATAPDGDIAIGTDGTIITEHVADKFFIIWCESDGQFDVDIGESGAGTWYLCIDDGFNLQVSDAITFT